MSVTTNARKIINRRGVWAVVLLIAMVVAGVTAGCLRNRLATALGERGQNIEIVAVRQNNADLALADDEYQITNYNVPVEVTYKLKNLEVGKYYSVSAGSDYHQFKAEATEKTETTSLDLNMTSEHIGANILLYSNESYSDNDSANLDFRVAGDGFVALGDIVVDEISQNGVALSPVQSGDDWTREYTFTANDAQALTVNLHTTAATAAMNYYVTYSANGGGSGDGYISAERPIMVTGEELEMGAALTIPAAFGMSDSSPFTLNLSISTVGANAYYYGWQRVVYQNYGQGGGSDTLKLSFYEDENVPRYNALLKYANGEEIDYNINPKYHDATHPLTVRVTGERYDAARNYEVRATVAVEYGETFYDTVFAATGAELNAGKDFTLEGLTLSLPEYDVSGHTSGYDLYYLFSLEIDGLKQSGSMAYVYDGWVNSVITYNTGEVVAMSEGGAIGGDNYVRPNAITMRRESLDSSKGAVLNYLGRAFDDELSYNYAIYYNGDAGENWWTAEAGTQIENGVLSGNYLNSQGLTVNIATPGSEARSVLYTLVISRNGGIVIAAKDFIIFEDAPRIERFKFTASSDSFMQTSASEYRVARGTNAEATLTGVGFGNETQYKLWVSYIGYERVECEYRYCYNEVDLSSLNYEATVTGAQLNNSVNYTVAYSELFGNVQDVNVYFDVTGIEGTRPPHGGMGGGESVSGGYAGHFAHIEYVNDDEVFRENGFQVDANGTVTNVSQPQSGEPQGGVPVDDKTPGDVMVHTEGGDTLVLVSDKPTVVVGYKNGQYQLVEVATTIDDSGVKTNSYSIGGFDEVKVVLKGDGDMDGEISSADSNLINRALISPTLRRYKELTPLQRLLFDLDGDGEITSADSNIINRSLISPTLKRYKKIEW